MSAALSRRDFVRLAGAATAALALPRRLGATALLKPFEVSASTYAWELHDEGVAAALDNMQRLAAVNSVYLVGVMHPERRPFRDGDFPHNPVRKTWQAEDARCYWHPTLSRYGRVKPRLSDNAWLSDTDWMRVLVAETRKRGLKTGVECSHALIDKERMEGEFADLAQRDIHGQPTRVRDWLRPPCPNHPDTREYALALMSDAVTSYDVDYVMSCIVSFDDGGPLRSGCFCEHCQAAAQRMGFDLKRIQASLLKDANAQPARGEWEEFRFRATADFYRFLHAGLHALKPGVELRYNVHMTGRNPLAWGVKLPLMQPHLDSVRIMDYSEQDGDPARMSGKREWLAQIRAEVGPKFPLLSALGVRLKATPELVREGVKIAVDTGMDGVTLGHYDGATFPILRAVREGLVAAGQRV
ncbi:MAG TPA: twin-arginine translocation signal domain-containing protein [Opitutaceae bacterium]|nr:twin-arginine translocation signal domain-containing protein [Opitutaceae bacterium]